jgi:hypothetical protein
MQVCPARSQSSSASSIITTADPCGSTPVHPRDFSHPSLAARLVDNPAQALSRGERLWEKISAATIDKSPAETTEKFQASYPGIFTVDEDVDTDDPTAPMMSTFNKVTFRGDDLANPLFLELAGIAKLQKRSDGGALPAYEFLFGPGLIVNTMAEKADDPVAKNSQVPWNVIAMELYREYKSPNGVGDLRFIVQYHVINGVTIAALEQLYEQGNISGEATADDVGWRKWDISCGTAMLTLLGTDNGVGAGFMLVDYRATLGGKQIVNIYTRRQRGWWHMVIEYASLT